MNEKIVVAANGYDRLDGRNAYHSDMKRITLGVPALKENRAMQIAAQLWTTQEDGTLKMSAELPIHQVFDLMIVLSRTLLYFKEAYRLPLLYDPDNPTIERIGLQGEALPVSICTENGGKTFAVELTNKAIYFVLIVDFRGSTYFPLTTPRLFHL